MDTLLVCRVIVTVAIHRPGTITLMSVLGRVDFNEREQSWFFGPTFADRLQPAGSGLKHGFRCDLDRMLHSVVIEKGNRTRP
jgi:hypothetical protein